MSPDVVSVNGVNTGTLTVVLAIAVSPRQSSVTDTENVCVLFGETAIV